ncbi:MAG TPA: phosphoribosylformylglycinamidine synthase subunit PurS [Candidatus Dormibacteraeota bacterium]|jgi:phosphoribosylformylglycinamidine synthase|nr:phosphoribosylformylglycinamidine synthase subunit PurS [Candidatus Dormibacteraeota bacterium]
MAGYTAEVYVVLKPLVNDPEGLVIGDGLRNLGFAGVKTVRSGKYLTIELEADDRAEAEQQVEEACQKLLANPVIEDYRFTVREVSAAT